MNSLIDLIGNTPLVEIKRLSRNKNVRILAKLEGNNPGGSVKDRAALYMIKKAMERGEVKPNTKLVEATSGNTGIALAMMARLFDLDIELVMPSNSTRERTLTMEAYGARVTLLDSIELCRDYAEEKGGKEGYYILNQFANADNALAHYETTGPEIWKDTNGEITHFVSSMGTTGTIMGCSRFFREKESGVKLIGCQPAENSSIPGIRRWPAGYVPSIFDASKVDEVIDITQQEAIDTTRQLARVEGLFGGMSTGGAAFTAFKVADTLEKGTIVFIACDRGDRYLSSNLFG